MQSEGTRQTEAQGQASAVQEGGGQVLPLLYSRPRAFACLLASGLRCEHHLISSPRPATLIRVRQRSAIDAGHAQVACDESCVSD